MKLRPAGNDRMELRIDPGDALKRRMHVRFGVGRRNCDRR